MSVSESHRGIGIPSLASNAQTSRRTRESLMSESGVIRHVGGNHLEIKIRMLYLSFIKFVIITHTEGKSKLEAVDTKSISRTVRLPLILVPGLGRHIPLGVQQIRKE